MKKKLLLAIPLAFVILGTSVALNLAGVDPVERTNATTVADPCPEGSYLIGYNKNGEEPICKLEPTGCPFGDSVPLDKCTPPPDIECNADWTSCKKNEVNNVPSEANDPRSTEGKEEQSSCSSSSK